MLNDKGTLKIRQYQIMYFRTHVQLHVLIYMAAENSGCLDIVAE